MMLVTGRKKNSFKSLVAMLDIMVHKVNKIEPLLEHLSDERILVCYEEVLGIIEEIGELLLTMKRAAPPASDADTILNLMSKCDKLINEIYFKTKVSIEGNKIKYTSLLDWSDDAPAIIKGCYFCSKPFERSSFRIISVKIQGVEVPIAGCDICSRGLKLRKKVKVLYFKRNGQTLHWSQFNDYTPSKDYWNLNKRGWDQDKAKLELVYPSSPEA